MLEAHLDYRGGRRCVPNQFGFQKWILTETTVKMVINIAARPAAGNWHQKNVCALVTLDLKNTFNTLQ